MTNTGLRFLWPALLPVALVLTALPAAADPTKDQCVDADTKAQSLRRAGHLAAAREQLRACVVQACPGLVRDDCAQRLDELERMEPTIVFQAQDGAGHDLTAVSVRLDGQRWLDRLDGGAVAVDPGAHTFVFESPGQVTVTRQFVIREGEKARRERVLFGASGAVAAPPASAPAAEAAPAEAALPPPPSPGQPPSTPPSSEPSSSPGQTQRVVAWVTGGAGIAGLVLGTVFGAVAMSDWNSAKSECTTSSCPAASYAQAGNNRSSALSAATASTVGFVLGGVLVAGGVALYLTAPAGPTATQRGLRLVPLVGAGSGGVQLEGGF